MGHLGFSYVGFLFLIMLFVPNILFTRIKPQGYEQACKKESRVLLCFERVGEALTTVCAVVFSDFNFRGLSLWSLWLAVSLFLMLLYEMGWVRYFKGDHSLKSFYADFCRIPVPLAVLPVLAFILLGIYGKVIPMIASAVVLGIGHIGIHLAHRRETVYK